MSVVCGPNAECSPEAVMQKNLTHVDGEGEESMNLCRCLNGFTGNASDTVIGCVHSK